MISEVEKILNRYLDSHLRLRIFLGKDGKIWNHEYDTMGYVGGSCGTRKRLLLLNNCRSLGGGLISDNVVGLKVTGRGGFLYFDPLYKLPRYQVLPCETPAFYDAGYKYCLYLNNELYGYFPTEKKAVGIGRFMSGLSDAKNSVGPLSGQHPKYS